VNPLRTSIAKAIFILTCTSSQGATFLSNGSGNWNTGTVWTPNGVPQTGTTDSVTIQSGHTVNQSGGVGLTLANGNATNDFGIANGNTVTIDGGTFYKVNGSWVRIGNKSAGTLDIKNGSAYIAGGELNIGLEAAGGAGVVKVGDGTGLAGTAVLNMRLTPSGADNGVNTNLNLGNILGSSGQLIVASDGVVDTDLNGTIRIGRYAHGAGQAQSALYVNAGGKFNAYGGMEIGANAGADALVHLNGTGATLTQYVGEFNLGYSGKGTMIIENSAQYIRESNPAERHNLLIGRSGSGTGELIVRSGGKFIRSAGGNVGDLIIGNDGTGTVTVSDGGEVLNNSGNWDWIGRYATGKGYVYVNEDGKYAVNGGGSLQLGTNTGALGLMEVNGGALEMTGGTFYVGYNGSGTLRQTSGTTNVLRIAMAAGSGTGTFEMSGGTVNTTALYMGGNTGGGTYGGNADVVGTAQATQSAGTVNVAGGLSIGLLANHTGTYEMTGGTVNHSAGDFSIGENGTGTMTIGANAVVNAIDDSNQFYVGRGNGSSGILIVNGSLVKNVGSYSIRVGHGDSEGTNNTTGTGLLGGTGTITSLNGIDIGARGTITAGTKSTVGTLTINGNLDLVGTPTIQSTLFINFDSASAYGADRIDLFGELTVDNAVIDGAWLDGNETGLDSRYWVVTRNGNDMWGSFANTYYESTNPLADQYAVMADGYIMIDGQEFAMFYNGDYATNSLSGGSDLVLSAMGSVPEPSHAILSLFGLTALLMRRRRKEGAC